jgi:hypothetical protein
VPALTPDDLGAAGADAERLADAVRQNDASLDPIYRQLDAVLSDLAVEGLDATALLPATSESGIGFSLRQTRDGKTLWTSIANATRSSLCDPQGDVRQHLAKGTQAGAGSLVGTILVALGLPVVAMPIAVAIAAVLLAVGIDGFCDWSALPPDEPPAS